MFEMKVSVGRLWSYGLKKRVGCISVRTPRAALVEHDSPPKDLLLLAKQYLKY